MLRLRTGGPMKMMRLMPPSERANWDETVVWDKAHLEAYTGGDVAVMRQVLGIFRDNAPAYLLDLAKTIDHWSQTAHKLKGAARGIGAWNLAVAAERAEKMAMPHADSDIRRHVIMDLTQRLQTLLGQLAEDQKDQP